MAQVNQWIAVYFLARRYACASISYGPVCVCVCVYVCLSVRFSEADIESKRLYG